MSKGSKKVVIVVCVLLIISLVCSYYLYTKLRGSTNEMDLKDYYGVDKYAENAIPLILNNEIMTDKAYVVDDEVYIDHEVVSTLISSKLYWDSFEKTLIVTTPTEIIKAKVGSNSIEKNGKSDKEFPKNIVKEMNKTYAISLTFIKEYANVEYKIYDSPKRIVMTSDWGNEVTKIKVVKNDVIRFKGDKDSDILAHAKVDDVLYVMQDEVHSFQRYIYVMTDDGIAGYIKNRNIGKAYKELLKNDYQEIEYPVNHMDKKVNLGWLQVSNMMANNNLSSLVNNAPGVNVVSPTWFSVTSADGGISSLASSNFVLYAHKKGIKVWALVDDFSKDVKLLDVMSKTKARTNLINNLVSATKLCGADGINVDFEYITKESSPHYIQFLRELSIKCRANKLVLSVDSYVPLSYNEHYKIDEQGEFVDYVVIMAYDEYHANSEESGSVASLSYTQTAVDRAMAKVPKEKLIIGMPFYSRLWGEKSDGNGNSVIDSVETVGMNEGVMRVKQGGGKLTWNEETMQYYSEYIQNGKTYRIWLENKKSIEEKLKVIMAADVAGVGEWRLGYETKDVWPTISAALNKK